jgi:hypothetical protein
MFKDYNILTPSSLYMTEVVSFIKNMILWQKDLDIHNHNTQRKLNLWVGAGISVG